jgi:hypothetical protein
MLAVRFQLRAVNVPENLPHERRKNEIESLPSYLQITSDFDDNLFPVYVGETAPGPDLADCPWLQVAPDGEPVDLKANHNGDWKSIIPLAVKSRELKTSTMRGQANLTLTAGATSASEVILFGTDIAFLNDDKGNLSLSLFCTEFDTYNSAVPTLLAMGEANGGLLLYGVPHLDTDGNIDGFTLYAKVPVALTSGGSAVERSLRVNWMFVGTTPEDV